MKVNIYLHNLADYTATNEVYKSRFGISLLVAHGQSPDSVRISGGSLVEIDGISYK